MGKIARLPFHLREQVNQRLADGETAPQIISWLNTRPEVNAILESFKWGPLTDGNISEWRKGGFQEWLNAPASRAPAVEAARPGRSKKIPGGGMQKKFAADFIARLGPLDPAEVYKAAREKYGYMVGGHWQDRRAALLARACEILDELAQFVSLRLALVIVSRHFHGTALDNAGGILKATPAGLFRYRLQWHARRSPETFLLHFENCGRKSAEAAQ